MVVDNADDTTIFFNARSQDIPSGALTSKPLAGYIPNSPNGSVLITTRDGRVGERLANRKKPIMVSPMTHTEAESLLRSKISDDEFYDTADDLGNLLDELACLPLAITQAAAFISENSLTVSQYMDALRTGDKDMKDLLSEHLEDPRRELDTENSVMRTWKLSFDQIVKEKPRAADILSLMAVLDLQGVSKSLLRHYQHDNSELGFTTALGVLQAFSLISAGSGDDPGFRMHRLVQLSTQKWLELQGKIAHWQTEALRILSEVFPESIFEVWPICEALTPHVQAVLSYKFNTDTDLLHCAKLLDFASLYDLDRGKYTNAYEKGTKGLKIRENLLRNDHHLVLQSVHTVGYVLYFLDDLPAAKGMLQRATTGRITILGRENLDTLRSMLKLANIMMEMGDFDVAEELYKEVLERREKLLGLDHPNTLSSVNALGQLMEQKGELDKAEPILQRALRGREKVLGPDHPDTMTTVHNLALVSGKQGNVDAAIEMYRRVAKKEERVLGVWHPERMVTVRNLAGCLREKGDLVAAEELYRDTTSGCEKTFGAEHPTTLLSVEGLADTLAEKAEYLEAIRLQEQVLAGRQKVFGAEHPNTLRGMGDLASSLEDQGDSKKAAELYEQALMGRQKVLGAEHPDTLQSLHDLAYCINDQGDSKKAADLYEQALAGRQKVLGFDHIDSLESLRGMAEAICDQGPERYEDAESWYRQAALIGEKLQGEEHLSVLSDLHRIAFLLDERGEHQEAEVLNRRVLGLREKVLGPLALESLESMNNVACAIQQQGGARLEEAEVLRRRVLSGYTQVLGSESEEALESLEALKDILNLQNKYDESEDLARLLITTKEKKLGSEHPDVLVAYYNLAWNLNKQGRNLESEEIYRRVALEEERTLGGHHAETLLTLTSMAWAIFGQGAERYEEVEQLAQRVLIGYEQTLGPKSEEALGCLEDLIRLMKIRNKPNEVFELTQRRNELRSEAEVPEESPEESPAPPSSSNLPVTIYRRCRSRNDFPKLRNRFCQPHTVKADV